MGLDKIMRNLVSEGKIPRSVLMSPRVRPAMNSYLPGDEGLTKPPLLYVHVVYNIDVPSVLTWAIRVLRYLRQPS